MSGNNNNGIATTVDHARIIGYVNQVKEEFRGQPQILQDFVDILTAHQTERISIRTAIRRVSILFRGNQRLIHGFKAFVPEGYDHEFPTSISGGGGRSSGSNNAASTTTTTATSSSNMRTSTSTTTRRRHHSNVATTTTLSVTPVTQRQQLQRQQQQQQLQLQQQQQQLQQLQKKKKQQQQPVAPVVQGPLLDDLKYDTQVQACVICLENVPICTAIPCMHMSYCVKCARKLCFGPTNGKEVKKRVGEIKCCVCRQDVLAIKRVHQS